MSKGFDDNFQKQVCSLLIRDEKFFTKYHNLVDPSIFELRPLEISYRIAQNYYQEYGKLISKLILLSECETQVQKEMKLKGPGMDNAEPLYAHIVEEIFGYDLESGYEWTDQKLREFIKRETQKSIARKFNDARDKGTSFDPIIEELHQTIQITASEDKYQSLSISDVLSFPQKEPIVEGFPFYLKHLYLLSGAGGSYKSLIILQMIKSLLTGVPLFGKYNILKKGPIILFDQETPNPILQDRFSKFEFNPSWPLTLYHFQGMKLDRPTDVEFMKRKIKEINPIAGFFDSLVRFHDKNENATTGEMSLVMEQLRSLSNLGPAVFSIHHFEKSGQGARGSTDIPNAVDLELKVKCKNDVINLEAGKVRIEKPDPIILHPTITNNSIRIEFEGSREELIIPACLKILKEQGGKMDLNQIGNMLDRIGLSVSNLFETLEVLQKLGHVKKAKEMVTGVTGSGRRTACSKWVYWLI